ncbi:MAG: hypothetical protein JOZ78_15795 [Chroococcidiopsidaceae cyanobacterium CP_BM_ER_R8_30]|nr:hypothetical protein [Chroococcidiopsidaceae cyanobacterium CP_BM_ER_R8_30]
MSNIEQELQKAVDKVQVPDSVSEQIQQEIKKAASRIDELIESERERARAVCDTSGSDSGDCAAAWDAVEELQAEASHQRAATQPKTSLEKYCDENPSAAECLIYDE